MLAMGTPTGILGPGPPGQTLSRPGFCPAQAHFCDDEAMSCDNMCLACVYSCKSQNAESALWQYMSMLV